MKGLKDILQILLTVILIVAVIYTNFRVEGKLISGLFNLGNRLEDSEQRAQQYWERLDFKTDSIISLSQFTPEIPKGPDIPPTKVITYTLPSDTVYLPSGFRESTPKYQMLGSKLNYGIFTRDSLRLVFQDSLGVNRSYQYGVDYENFNYTLFNNGIYPTKITYPVEKTRKLHFYVYGGYDFLAKRAHAEGLLEYRLSRIYLQSRLGTHLEVSPQAYWDIRAGYRLTR